MERRIKGKYNLKELYAIILLSNITILHALFCLKITIDFVINEYGFIVQIELTFSREEKYGRDDRFLRYI